MSRWMCPFDSFYIEVEDAYQKSEHIFYERGLVHTFFLPYSGVSRIGEGTWLTIAETSDIVFIATKILRGSPANSGQFVSVLVHNTHSLDFIWTKLMVYDRPNHIVALHFWRREWNGCGGARKKRESNMNKQGTLPLIVNPTTPPRSPQSPLGLPPHYGCRRLLKAYCILRAPPTLKSRRSACLYILPGALTRHAYLACVYSISLFLLMLTLGMLNQPW